MSKATLTIEGFVAADPELRTHNGKSVLSVTVPHTPRRKNQQTGQYEDAGETLWVQASFWEQQADAIAAEVRKGTLVAITGIPELNVYTKNDGSTAAQLRLVFGTLAVIPRVSAPQPAYAGAPAQSDEPWSTPGSSATDAWETASAAAPF